MGAGASIDCERRFASIRKLTVYREKLKVLVRGQSGIQIDRSDREPWSSVLQECIQRSRERARPALSRLQVKDILQGGVPNVEEYTRSLHKEIRVFVSSTFTDTKYERDILMEDVYPYLRMLCRNLGLSFTVVDMRWGIRDQSTNTHQTTRICLKEIARCRRVSVGPYFAAILGDKYGYNPLPTSIPSGLFTTLAERMNPEDEALFKKWYKEDISVRPRSYVLLAIDTHLPAYSGDSPSEKRQAERTWWRVLEQLLLAITQANENLSDLPVGVSVTELEVIQGILSQSKASLRNRTLCYLRSIPRLSELGDSRRLYQDLTDDNTVKPDALEKLRNLRYRVQAHLPRQCVIQYTLKMIPEPTSDQLGEGTSDLDPVQLASSAQKANESSISLPRRPTSHSIAVDSPASPLTPLSTTEQRTRSVSSDKVEAPQSMCLLTRKRSASLDADHDGGNQFPANTLARTASRNRRSLQEPPKSWSKNLLVPVPSFASSRTSTEAFSNGSKPGSESHEMTDSAVSCGSVRETPFSVPGAVVERDDDDMHVFVDLTTQCQKAELMKFADDFCSRMVEDIMAAVCGSWPRGDDLVDEVFRHNMFCHDRSKAFVGQSDLLIRIDNFIKSREKLDDNIDMLLRMRGSGRNLTRYLSASSSSGIFAVHGPSGCGKTSILARAAWLSWARDHLDVDMNDDLSTDDDCSSLSESDGGEPRKRRSSIVIEDPVRGDAPSFPNGPERTPTTTPTYVIMRFLGTTPDSSTAAGVLRSICRQLSRLCDLDEQTVPFCYEDLIDDFPDRLLDASEKGRIVIFLDSIDQLQNDELEHNLRWLPPVLPQGVTVILSTVCSQAKAPLRNTAPQRTGRESEEKGKKHKEACRKEEKTAASSMKPGAVTMHVLRQRSHKGGSWQVKFAEVHPLTRDDAEHALSKWLYMKATSISSQYDGQRGKRNPHCATGVKTAMWTHAGPRAWPTETQRRIILSSYEECQLPLYLRLAFNEAKQWKSFSRMTQCSLPPSVSALIHGLYQRLEHNHGYLFTRYSLAYITAAKHGLAINELEDVLSCKEACLDSIFQYWEPPVRRVPPALWTRLHEDVGEYLSERGADDITVYSWFHRQFAIVCTDRYLSKRDQKREAHKDLAAYFLGRWCGTPKPFKDCSTGKVRKADRKVASQPLVLDWGGRGDSPLYNLRRLSELPYHVIQGHLWDCFKDVLCDLQFIEAKCRGGQAVALLTELGRAASLLSVRRRSSVLQSINGSSGGMRTFSSVSLASSSASVDSICSSLQDGVPSYLKNPGEPIIQATPSLTHAESPSDSNSVTTRGLETLLKRMHRFLRSQIHIIARHPYLTLQLAYNQPPTSGPCVAALALLRSSQVRRRIICHRNRTTLTDPCSLVLSGFSSQVVDLHFRFVDGSMLIACATQDGEIRLHDIDNGIEIKRFHRARYGKTDAAIAGLLSSSSAANLLDAHKCAISLSGQYGIVIASFATRVTQDSASPLQVWSYGSGEDHSRDWSGILHHTPQSSLGNSALSLDSSLGSSTSTKAIMNAVTKGLAGFHNEGFKAYTGSCVKEVAFSPNGDRILVQLFGRIAVYCMSSFRQLALLSHAVDVDRSPLRSGKAGSKTASAQPLETNCPISIDDTQTPPIPTSSFVFSTDNRYIAGAGRVWSAEGKHLCSVADQAATMTPEVALTALRASYGFRQGSSSLSSSASVPTRRGSGSTEALNYSARHSSPGFLFTGKHVAFACGDVIRVLGVPRGKEVQCLRCFPGANGLPITASPASRLSSFGRMVVVVEAFATSPCTPRLVASCSDRALRVWNPLEGIPLAFVRLDTLHRHIVSSIIFTPSGETFATCGLDKTVRVWDIDEVVDSFHVRDEKEFAYLKTEGECGSTYPPSPQSQSSQSSPPVAGGSGSSPSNSFSLPARATTTPMTIVGTAMQSSMETLESASTLSFLCEEPQGNKSTRHVVVVYGKPPALELLSFDNGRRISYCSQSIRFQSIQHVSSDPLGRFLVVLGRALIGPKSDPHVRNRGKPPSPLYLVTLPTGGIEFNKRTYVHTLTDMYRFNNAVETFMSADGRTMAAITESRESVEVYSVSYNAAAVYASNPCMFSHLTSLRRGGAKAIGVAFYTSNPQSSTPAEYQAAIDSELDEEYSNEDVPDTHAGIRDSNFDGEVPVSWKTSYKTVWGPLQPESHQELQGCLALVFGQTVVIHNVRQSSPVGVNFSDLHGLHLGRIEWIPDSTVVAVLAATQPVSADQAYEAILCCDSSAGGVVQTFGSLARVSASARPNTAHLLTTRKSAAFGENTVEGSITSDRTASIRSKSQITCFKVAHRRVLLVGYEDGFFCAFHVVSGRVLASFLFASPVVSIQVDATNWRCWIVVTRDNRVECLELEDSYEFTRKDDAVWKMPVLKPCTVGRPSSKAAQQRKEARARDLLPSTSSVNSGGFESSSNGSPDPFSARSKFMNTISKFDSNRPGMSPSNGDRDLAIPTSISANRSPTNSQEMVSSPSPNRPTTGFTHTPKRECFNEEKSIQTQLCSPTTTRTTSPASPAFGRRVAPTPALASSPNTRDTALPAPSSHVLSEPYGELTPLASIRPGRGSPLRSRPSACCSPVSGDSQFSDSPESSTLRHPSPVQGLQKINLVGSTGVYASSVRSCPRANASPGRSDQPTRSDESPLGRRGSRTYDQTRENDTASWGADRGIEKVHLANTSGVRRGRRDSQRDAQWQSVLAGHLARIESLENDVFRKDNTGTPARRRRAS
eukprot:Rmarinus@m.18027